MHVYEWSILVFSLFLSLLISDKIMVKTFSTLSNKATTLSSKRIWNALDPSDDLVFFEATERAISEKLSKSCAHTRIGNHIVCHSLSTKKKIQPIHVTILEKFSASMYTDAEKKRIERAKCEMLGYFSFFFLPERKRQLWIIKQSFVAADWL